jgi:DNA topoisomerase-1
MAPAVFDTVRVDIVAKQYVFRATGSNLKFPGFYAVWPREEDEKLLPTMKVNEALDLHGLKPEQHFTQPPPRYSEASLIKELEEQGIGRPSTYVTIISTIQDRGYVEQEQRRFVPTQLGWIVNEVMNKHFPEIVDIGFTADMERKLDDIEEGRRSWTEFLHNFYGDFKTTLGKAEAEMERVQKPVEELDEQCPECGRNLIIRSGRFGRFISCSGFPECRYGRSVVNKTGALCPLCSGDIVERKTRQKKRIFYGCNNYPACNFAIWERPVPDLCPKCGGLMVIAKPGQDPVCYQEVVAPQRSAEEEPQADGKKATRTTKAKKSTATSTANDEEVKKTTTRRTTATRKKATAKAASGEAVDVVVEQPVASNGKKAATTSRRASSRSTATNGTTTKKTGSTRKTTSAANSTAKSRSKAAK